MKKSNTPQRGSDREGEPKPVAYPLYFRFTLPGDTPDLGGYHAITRVKKRRWAAEDRAREIAIRALGASERTQRAAERKIEKLISSPNLRQAFREEFQKWLSTNADPRKRQWNEAARQVRMNLYLLDDGLRSGDADAAEAVLGVATDAILALDTADPAVLRPLARMNSSWPAFVSREGLDSETTAGLNDIQLGKDTFEGQLRKPHGADPVPRKWARQILHTLERNKRSVSLTGHPAFDCELRLVLRKEIASGEATIPPLPDWASESVSLKPFEAATWRDWWNLGKRMIRQQCPDFHLHSDWLQYARRWDDHSRKGEIQNRILDLIESAMKRLARKQA